MLQSLGFSKMESISSRDSIQMGFERLLPQIEQLPKMGTVQAYALQPAPSQS